MKLVMTQPFMLPCRTVNPFQFIGLSSGEVHVGPIHIFEAGCPYAEPVSCCTPICESGEPTGPMENGRTYMVRPRIEPLKSSFSRLRIANGFSQSFRWTGVVLRKRTNKSTILHASNIVRGTAGIITTRPEVLIKFDERAGGDELGAQPFVLLVGTIDPMNRCRLREIRHLLHPAKQVLVGRHRARTFQDTGSCSHLLLL